MGSYARVMLPKIVSLWDISCLASACMSEGPKIAPEKCECWLRDMARGIEVLAHRKHYTHKVMQEQNSEGGPKLTQSRTKVGPSQAKVVPKPA